jgi:hypothetical protein
LIEDGTNLEKESKIAKAAVETLFKAKLGALIKSAKKLLIGRYQLKPSLKISNQKILITLSNVHNINKLVGYLGTAI